LSAYSKALEVIPRQLCENAGFDSTDILAALRRKHALTNNGSADDKSENSTNSKWYGVDLVNGDICDTFQAGIWEPCGNKINAFEAATEAACLILSIDETIVAPRSQDPGAAASGMMGNNNKPMTNMMNSAMEATQGGARSGQLGPGVSYMKGRGGG
jgi:T-complex protein 1 subunit eta